MKFMEKIDKAMQNIYSAKQYNNTFSSEVRYERERLKVFLGDKQEAKRLITLIDSKSNPYDKKTEAEILNRLNRLILMGFETHLIRIAADVNNYDYCRMQSKRHTEVSRQIGTLK